MWAFFHTLLDKAESDEMADIPDAPVALGAKPGTTVSPWHTVATRLHDLASQWRVGAVPLLTVVLFIVVVLASDIGNVTISPWHAVPILLNATHLFHFTPTWPPYEAEILLTQHLPRVMGALLVGMALGVAGALFQGLLRNPLADPLLLGTSSGAALGATLAFLLPGLTTLAFQWQGFSLVAVLAFVGALLAVALVYQIATRHGQTPVITLLLAGVAVSAMLTALQTLLINFTPRLGLQLYSIYNWIAGEINVRDWPQIAISAIVLTVCLSVTLFLAPVLDAFALGEEMTAHLGLAVERYKLIIIALGALLVAVAVSMSGLVGFVGLVSPHLCRLAFGPRHRLLLPTTALTGAIFVVLADLLARSIIPQSEIPLGVVTALVGGPFFLSLLSKSGERYRW